jgi:hypothetical protein
MPVPSDIVGQLLDMLQGPYRKPTQPKEISWFVQGANAAWDGNWGPSNYDAWLAQKGLVATEKMEAGRRIRVPARQPTPQEGFFMQGAAAVIRYKGLW